MPTTGNDQDGTIAADTGLAPPTPIFPDPGASSDRFSDDGGCLQSNFRGHSHFGP